MSFLIYLALVPALAFAAQWLAWKSGLPGILLLLLFGMLLGQFVRPDDVLAILSGGSSEIAGPRILFPIVSLAVAIIMFEGGLSLKVSELKEAGGAAFRLCTIGAIATLTGAGVSAYWVLGLDWRMCCLLGAILVVTGPTVIGPLLRQVQPSSRVSNTLKWEGIVIDPIGAVAAVLVFEVLMLNPGENGFTQGCAVVGQDGVGRRGRRVVGRRRDHVFAATVFASRSLARRGVAGSGVDPVCLLRRLLPRIGADRGDDFWLMDDQPKRLGHRTHHRIQKRI